MAGGKYNNVNNYYQYLRDEQSDLLDKQKRQQAMMQFQRNNMHKDSDAFADGAQTLAGSFSDYGTDSLAKVGLTGFASGLKQGNEGKRLDFDNKFFETMEKFGAQNESIKERIREAQTREYAKEKMKPYVVAYLKKMHEMSPDVRESQARKLVEQSNKLLGDDDSLLSVDGSNPAIFTVQSNKDGRSATIDMGVFFAGDGVTEQELAEWQTSAIMKRDAEAEEKAEKLQLEKEKLAVTQAKNAYDQDPVLAAKKEALITYAKEQQKIVPEIQSKIIAFNRTDHILDRMKSIVEQNPNALKSYAKVVWKDQDPNTFTQTLQNIYQATGDGRKNSKDIGELNKLMKELVIDKSALFSRPNMFIEKIAEQSSPNTNMSPEAFFSVIDYSKRDIENQLLIARTDLKNAYDYIGMTPSEHYMQKRESEIEELPLHERPNGYVSGVGLGDKQRSRHPIFSVKDAGTGEVIKFEDKNKATLMIQKGGILL